MPGIDTAPDQATPDLTPDQGGDTGGAPPPPPLAFPPHLMPVALWRSRLRRLIFDAPLDPADPTTVVIPDAALDDALRESLSALTTWSPAVCALPPLTLTAGQTTYPLPADFAEPVEETWGALLGPDPFLSGRAPGSRYALLRMQSDLSAAAPASVRSGGGAFGGYGVGYGGYWARGMILPTDAQGNVIAGGTFTRPRAALFPADFAHPTPYLVLSPAPTATGPPMTALTYRAAHLPRRLTALTDGSAWAVDASGSLVFSLAPLGADFADATDVLPFAVTDDLVRQSLRYATHWILSQIIASLSDTDGTTYAFFEERVGKGRESLQKVADAALDEFKERNQRRARGVRG